MTNYIFIETRDPFESRDTRFLVETATALKERGNEVTVFLVQNGVLAARRAAHGSHLPTLSEAGVRLLADDFSLAERGIGESEMLPGVRQAGIDSLVDFLARDDTKAVWH